LKKLLYQFDTDPLPAVFDNVVGYDGGADHISAYGGVTAANVGGLVEGAIFTRGPKDKKNTAIFIGGANMAEGQALLDAVRRKFFAKFRVSVMFDCNGSNTTAAAAVAWLAHGRSLKGKRAVVLAGTGPVGQRAAALLTNEGAAVAITGRKLEVVQAACQAIRARFGAEVLPIAAATAVERGNAVEGAQIALATGAAGITLLEARQWQESRSLELVADANASPPAGIEGVGMADRGAESHGKILFGPLGFGALKLALHRACIARLFEQNDLLLDAEEIYALAKSMVGQAPPGQAP
jgi:methylenetetrahydrofolate/methylenetetrahydromethanopterin dehydrogenase (NADP+)